MAGSDALQGGVGARTVGQVLDPGHGVVAAFGDDVGGAELAGELLAWTVGALGDDPLGADGGRGQDADGAVADDGDGHVGLHVGGDGGEPAGAHHIGQRQQAGDHLGGGMVWGGDEGAVGERDA